MDGRIFTTGGAAPTFDLILYLIRSRYGHTLALEVASAFIYDGKAQADSPQPLVSLGALEQHEPQLSAAVRLMEAHLDSPLKTQEVADALGFSVRSLENLFRRRLDISPHQYYKRLRLQAARRLVVDSRHSMQEIAVRTGFNSLAVFPGSSVTSTVRAPAVTGVRLAAVRLLPAFSKHIQRRGVDGCFHIHYPQHAVKDVVMGVAA
ncbi:helix-turn-helix domain-containing protein [Aliamphritea spongicola]|nr:helix-turn-helix domain-containing protein [Aliamphritea spongicola]